MNAIVDNVTIITTLSSLLILPYILVNSTKLYAKQSVIHGTHEPTERVTV